MELRLWFWNADQNELLYRPLVEFRQQLRRHSGGMEITMIYYHVNLETNKIVAGPFSPQDRYVKNVTKCGNPELLDLAAFGFLPAAPSTATDDDDLGTPVFSGGEVVFPTVQPTLAEVRRRKRARVAEICANKIDNAVAVSGSSYDASAANRALLHELLGHAERNPTATVVVKQKNGTPVALTLAQLRAVVAAVAEHTAACLANEKAMYDAIGTATRAQLRAMDLQAGWPA